MLNKNLKKLILVTFIVSFSGSLVFAQAAKKKETTELEDIANDFKEAKFLQVDSLKIPKELTRIEEQIKQNAIDVVIHSRTHTPVFAQKLPKGYTEGYTKFHGLQVEIAPIPKDQDFYSLNFFYYNWTNRKVDKTLKIRISKYNVLNEMRFGLYELLLGKQYVRDNKDALEKQNFDRIQAVRKTIEEKEKEEREKKREKKKLEEKLEQLRLEKEERERNLIKRPDFEKKDKGSGKKEDKLSEDSDGTNGLDGDAFGTNVEDPDKAAKADALASSKDQKSSGDKNKAKNKKADQINSKFDENGNPVNPDAPELVESGINIPIKSTFYAFGSLFEEKTESIGIIPVGTNLRYLGFGARYVQEQISDSPRGMRFNIRSGVPIKKDDYDFPVNSAFETEITRGNILKYFKAFLGLDYSPIIFINLPTSGEGLQVFKNDIFWAKIGLTYLPSIFGKDLEIRAAFLKSLLINSNQNKEFTGTSLIFSTYYQHTDKYGFEMFYQQTYLVGDLDVESKAVGLSYVYKFEN